MGQTTLRQFEITIFDDYGQVVDQRIISCSDEAEANTEGNEMCTGYDNAAYFEAIEQVKEEEERHG